MTRHHLTRLRPFPKIGLFGLASGLGLGTAIALGDGMSNDAKKIEADLSGANLYGANLSGANLYEADLSRAAINAGYWITRASGTWYAGRTLADGSTIKVGNPHGYRTKPAAREAMVAAWCRAQFGEE